MQGNSRRPRTGKCALFLDSRERTKSPTNANFKKKHKLNIDWFVLLGEMSRYNCCHKKISALESKLFQNSKFSWINLYFSLIEKKFLHATYTESKRLHLPKQVNDYIQFSKIRASCLKLSRELYAKYIAETEGRIREIM